MFARWSLPKSWVLYPNVHSIFITSCAIPISVHQRPITNPKNISMLYLVQRPNPRYVDMVVFVWTRQHECQEINRLQNERDIIAVVSHLLAIVSLLYVADNSGKCGSSSSSSTLSSRWVHQPCDYIPVCYSCFENNNVCQHQLLLHRQIVDIFPSWERVNLWTNPLVIQHGSGKHP